MTSLVQAHINNRSFSTTSPWTRLQTHLAAVVGLCLLCQSAWSAEDALNSEPMKLASTYKLALLKTNEAGNNSQGYSFGSPSFGSASFGSTFDLLDPILDEQTQQASNRVIIKSRKLKAHQERLDRASAKSFPNAEQRLQRAFGAARERSLGQLN